MPQHKPLAPLSRTEQDADIVLAQRPLNRARPCQTQEEIGRATLIPKDRLVAALRLLDARRYGRYIVGRRNGVTRFQWGVPFQSATMYRVVQPETTPEEEEASEEEVTKEPTIPPAPTSSPPSLPPVPTVPPPPSLPPAAPLAPPTVNSLAELIASQTTSFIPLRGGEIMVAVSMPPDLTHEELLDVAEHFFGRAAFEERLARARAARTNGSGGGGNGKGEGN